MSDIIKSNKIILLVAVLLMIFVLYGCGNSQTSYSGNWYDSSNPDGDYLELYDDGMFSYGQVTGEYSVEDSNILLMPSNSLYDSAVVYIDTYDGENCLIDEDGIRYFNSFEKANDYYIAMEEAEADAIENEATSGMALLENYIPGEWQGNGSYNEDSKYVFYEDGTYEHYFKENVFDSGSWTIEDDREWEKFEIVLEVAYAYRGEYSSSPKDVGDIYESCEIKYWDCESLETLEENVTELTFGPGSGSYIKQ